MQSLTTTFCSLPAGRLCGENPLPAFRSPQENIVCPTDPRLPDDERKFAGWKAQFRVLPHRLQDDYTREHYRRDFKALVLENRFLRATFLPELGGRLISLVHKPLDRELLDRNPVFQPANLAIRNAWFSGGVEWNMSCFGHHHLTCSSVFAARVRDPQGYDVLRLYEFDRTKAFPWQIDFHLPPDSRSLFVRVRLINPHAEEIPMYWWSNIAVPETPDTRVLMPARSALHNVADQPLTLTDMPTLFGKDASYTTNVPITHEFFYRMEKDRRPWIAALTKDGRGLYQTSTARLAGRKLFCWGMGSGGRNWQTYLSQSGRAYIEIQAGLAKIQATCLPMPARTEWSWTEAYGLLEADAPAVHAADWNTAWQSTEAALDAQLPRAELDARHAAWGRTATLPAEEILHMGSGWGALERKRIQANRLVDSIPAELDFPAVSLGAEQQPWLDLLEKGALPALPADARDPGAYLVQDEWRWLLERQLAAGQGDHWLSWYHLGVARLESHDPVGARKAWEKSLALSPTAWAHRNLAVLAKTQGRAPAALEHYANAWACGPQTSALAVEYAQTLSDAGKFAPLQNFIRGLAPGFVRHERMLIFKALAALKAGRLDEVPAVFAHPFATIREGELTLSNIWFEWQARRIAAAENIPYDDSLMQRVQREFPPPSNIDFRLLGPAPE